MKFTNLTKYERDYFKLFIQSSFSSAVLHSVCAPNSACLAFTDDGDEHFL